MVNVLQLQQCISDVRDSRWWERQTLHCPFDAPPICIFHVPAVWVRAHHLLSSSVPFLVLSFPRRPLPLTCPSAHPSLPICCFPFSFAVPLLLSVFQSLTETAFSFSFTHSNCFWFQFSSVLSRLKLYLVFVHSNNFDFHPPFDFAFHFSAFRWSSLEQLDWQQRTHRETRHSIELCTYLLISLTACQFAAQLQPPCGLCLICAILYDSVGLCRIL